MIALAAGYFLFWLGDEPPPPPPPPPVVENRCTAEALAALSGGFAAVEAQIDACGGDVTADTAFAALDGAQRGGDARALEIMGTLYDTEATEPVFKGRLGIGLENNPGVAARYYSEARAAGSTGAGVRLQGVCARLKDMTGTAEQGAYNDYCR